MLKGTMAVYYKATITKGTLEATVYLYEKTYSKLMETIDFLYKYATIEAIELELITKHEYDNQY
tara:strand:+ start:464 stop:655 length:192 start_codon:yes stop_codon:yes gene_type:complete